VYFVCSILVYTQCIDLSAERWQMAGNMKAAGQRTRGACPLDPNCLSLCVVLAFARLPQTWRKNKNLFQHELYACDSRAIPTCLRRSRRQGTGTQTWPDGRRYVGDFEHDAMQGKGKAVFPDGTVYEVPSHHCLWISEAHAIAVCMERQPQSRESR